MVKYLIRLDDACPTMDKQKWEKIQCILDLYGVNPMVGVVPNNKDENLIIDKPDPEFWKKIREWQSKGWTIALHGYDHCYISNDGGINPIWNRSEFAGVSVEIQREKIRKGISILKKNGIEARFFFAPSHTFDKNTLFALKEESEIRVISDTIATKPYKNGEFSFFPQLGGHCSKKYIPGVWTFCLHPSMMSDDSFCQTELFIKKYRSSFVSFDDLDITNLNKKDIFSRLLSWSYFKYRHIRRIK